jgi:predicted transcriptional regulator
MEGRGADAWSHWQRLFPLLDAEGRLASLLTRSQMMVSAKQADLSMPLAEDGNSAPMTMAPTDTLRTAAAAMAETRLTRFPVIDAMGKFVGIITIDDLLSARSRETLRENDRTRVLRVRWPFSSSNRAVTATTIASPDGEGVDEALAKGPADTA